LLDAMDGGRSMAEIVAVVRAAHPGQPERTIESGLRQLVRSGHVEDAVAPHPPELTDRDLERYDRSMRYLRWMDLTPRASSWDPQVMLRSARVTVLGVGGTGGIAAQALAAAGIGHLHCVDFDTVELSNLCRQVLYTEDDIGKSKVDAAVTRLGSLNSDIEVTGQHLRVDSYEILVLP
jgi:molybdopterin/thiamine biosynthesis adenylyltransferase